MVYLVIRNSLIDHHCTWIPVGAAGGRSFTVIVSSRVEMPPFPSDTVKVAVY